MVYQRLLVACGTVALVAASGCGFGPRAIRHERADYNAALQQTASEQMLLNLVRLKYREPTLFLEVSSVSAHFEYATETEMIALLARHGGSTLTGRAMPTYSEQPTVTYSPLQGEAYANRIISEVGLNRVAPLYSTGWRVDRLIRLLVERAGDLRNDPTLPGARGETLTPHAKLLEVAGIWRKLQKSGDLLFLTPTKDVVLTSGIRPEQMPGQGLVAAEKEGYRFVPAKDGTWELRRTIPAGLIIQAAYSDEKDANTVDAHLKVKPLRTRDREGRFVERIKVIAFSDATEGSDKLEVPEVPVQIRSLNGILFYLGQGVEVPEDHVAKGIVKVYHEPEGEVVDHSTVLGDLLKVHCSPTRPADAYVAVRYRGYWFYLADNELESKDTFSLLLILFALQSGEVKSAQPLLTLPVGGR